MRSDKQNQASKNNGKKSKGPVTEEGKANSARNASTHNLVGQHFILLSNEEPAEFELHESGYLQRFQPLDSVEYDLVQKMIIATWRERRIGIMESSLFELEMERQRLAVDAEFADLGPGPRQVLAIFGTTDAAAASALLLRYGSAARRQFASAYRILRDLQGDRFNRTGVTNPASTTGSAPTADPQPVQELPAVAQSQPVATAMANPSRSRLTVVRRFPVEPDVHPEITKLPNEPKPVAMTAANGASHIASHIFDALRTGATAA